MLSALPPPAVDNSVPPRMHEIGEYRFQRFVADLFGYEPNIATSSEYGMRGQADDGADVVVARTGGDGKEVASCKCYEATTPAEVRKASDEFLDHCEEHWLKQDIRRFVLATTAVNANSRGVQDQDSRERERFAALGIEYEFWGPRVQTQSDRSVAGTDGWRAACPLPRFAI